LHRVAAANALLLIAAVGATIAFLAPRKVSTFAIDETAGALAGALVLVALVNLYLLRRVISPLEKLTAFARRVDLARPDHRMPEESSTAEAAELAHTFNEMLSRLAAERREATGRVLAGQEAERLRIARELHDQIGQELTAILLGLARLHARAPTELQEEIAETQEAVRSSLEDVRQIAVELRPEALDELGLPSALAVLGERFGERSRLHVEQHIAERLPRMSPDVELVVYRVAQEALTNVARHSGVTSAELTLTLEDGGLVLTVRDRGRGLDPAKPPGSGIRGMRERAGLIGARLGIAPGPAGRGCEVRLVVPAADRPAGEAASITTREWLAAGSPPPGADAPEQIPTPPRGEAASASAKPRPAGPVAPA
jgi:two-component system sensor histidine kinase UhpB